MSNPRYFELELPTADQRFTGIIALLTAGENLAFGDAVYLKASDSKMWKANSNSLSTMPCIALATATIAADAQGRFLMFGFMRKDAWTFTPKGFIYVHTTGGNPTQTMPSGTGKQVQILGVAQTANIIFITPSFEIVEIS